MRRRAPLVLLVIIAALTAAPRADAALECFGKKATLPIGATTGTAGNDVIIGTNGNDLIDSLGGDDRICSRDGRDRVEGGTGNDKIDGGNGVDFLIGDVLDASDITEPAGNDVLKGGAGFISLQDFTAEALVGDHFSENGSAIGGGDDKLDGGTDGAKLFGDSVGITGAEGGGNDRLSRGSYEIVGDSQVLGNSASPLMVTGSGDDTITVLGDSVAIVGDSRVRNNDTGDAYAFDSQDQDGNDTITASTDNDVIVGDHSAEATGGGAVAFSGWGDDSISALSGDDDIYGDCADGPDVINDASESHDCEDFEAGTYGGDDTLLGGNGEDEILAGFGDDQMTGGSESDTCNGQGGTDSGTCDVLQNVP